MRPDNETSGSTTATMSASERKAREPQAKAPPAPDVPADDLSESDFLAQQAEAAKAAIAKAASEFASKLGQGVDPAAWARQYPWVTLGAATVAGFVATSLLVPSKEQQALKKLAAIERALNPSPPLPPAQLAAVQSTIDGKAGEAAYKSGQSGLMRVIIGEVIGAIKPAVISLLTAGVTAAQAKPSPAEMQAHAAAAVDRDQGGEAPPAE